MVGKWRVGQEKDTEDTAWFEGLHAWLVERVAGFEGAWGEYCHAAEFQVIAVASGWVDCYCCADLFVFVDLVEDFRGRSWGLEEC